MNNAGPAEAANCSAIRPDGGASRRQSVGRDQRHADLRPRDDPAGDGRGDRQHRLEAGHHLPTRRHGLQRLEGRGEGRDKALAHELRNTEGGRITAHLLIPGFAFTSITKGTRMRSRPPPGRLIKSPGS